VLSAGILPVTQKLFNKKEEMCHLPAWAWPEKKKREGLKRGIPEPIPFLPQRAGERKRWNHRPLLCAAEQPSKKKRGRSRLVLREKRADGLCSSVYLEARFWGRTFGILNLLSNEERRGSYCFFYGYWQEEGTLDYKGGGHFAVVLEHGGQTCQGANPHPDKGNRFKKKEEA